MILLSLDLGSICPITTVSLFRQVNQRPLAVGIQVIDRLVIDDRIGESIVVGF
jgi:hypothetical protein